jgi:hypothetical protein
LATFKKKVSPTLHQAHFIEGIEAHVKGTLQNLLPPKPYLALDDLFFGFFIYFKGHLVEL